MSRNSLRSRLTWLIIAVMLGVLIPLGVISYQRQSTEMNELLDGRLAQAGRTLGVLIAHGDGIASNQEEGAVVPAPPGMKEEGIVSVHRRNYEPEVGFQAYDQLGRPILASENLADLAPPTESEQGFGDIDHAGHRWRIFTLRNRVGLTIRIGERYDNREKITRELILEHSLPLVIGLPLLTVLVSWAVRRGLRPLSLLTRQLAERTPGSRQLIALDKTPQEIKPLIATLNQQLERLEDAIEREHRFNADVAHELRTPLAATMIHLESAAIADSPADTSFALKNAEQSLTRLARRIEQILALARLEAGAASQQRTPLDLMAIALEVIEEFAAPIAEKDVSLSLLHDAPELYVLGHEAALTAMFRNLVENALRYVPVAGQVEIVLRHENGHAVIDISDDGPGIPPERHDAVFERFHRETDGPSKGYGLGLSIVRRAVQLHDARIELLDSAFGHGLHLRITIPLA